MNQSQRFIRLAFAAVAVAFAASNVGGQAASQPAMFPSSVSTSLDAAREAAYRQLISDLRKNYAAMTVQAQQLSLRNAKLEQQLKEAESLMQKGLVVPAPQSSIPHEWRKRSIDGQTFYIIPLAATGKATAVLIRSLRPAGRH